jgi:hypothetical protein
VFEERARALFAAEEMASTGNGFALGHVALTLRIQHHRLRMVGLFSGGGAEAIPAAGQKNANEKKENAGKNEEKQES